MDSNNGQGSGSFMANAGGGGSAIQRALQRRAQGGGGPNISQNGVLPAAVPSPATHPAMPHPSSFVPPQAQAAMQAQQPPQGQAPAPVPTSPMPGQPMTDPQAPLMTVLEAMADFIESQSKIAEAQSGVQ